MSEFCSGIVCGRIRVVWWMGELGCLYLDLGHVRSNWNVIYSVTGLYFHFIFPWPTCVEKCGFSLSGEDVRCWNVDVVS